MRWSLSFALIAIWASISLLASGFVLKEDRSSFGRREEPYELLARAQARAKSTVRVPSRVYRKTAARNPKPYLFSGSKVTVVPKAVKGRVEKGKHADHLLEIQTFNEHLKSNGVTFGQLSPKTKLKAINIINSKKNLAFIPGGINSGKGQSMKWAMKGYRVKPKADRDNYMYKVHSSAKQTAKRLDRAYKSDKKLDIANRKNWVTAKDFYREAMRKTGVLNGRVSPATSSSGSGSSGSSDSGHSSS
ncbi:hypothetical protein BKA70DRAFT_1237675 [Coprinopsis sp. MPI-PUGE-AT-0042]|nr:hypothetical protein BKA70DRAFT_1237675 [Coprinopsis sp. MPI-PUGE-AT-0042]